MFYQILERDDGLMVTALDSGSSLSGSSPGQINVTYSTCMPKLVKRGTCALFLPNLSLNKFRKFSLSNPKLRQSLKS